MSKVPAVTALAPAAARARVQSWRWWLLLGLAALAGIALRLYVARGVIGDPDSDEAIPGLMVRHFLHGHLNVFYWGQAYGGTQEILLTVPLFWLFGASWTVLRLVPVALSAAACIVLWRAGLRLYGETAGRAAAAVMWVWPPFAVYYLTHQYGFYASDVLYCALLVLLALRAVERPDVVRAAAFGLVLGLAFWETEQIVPVALPVIGWTIWRRPRLLRHAWAAAGAAAIGALPWLVWNARHDWASLNALPGGATYWHRIRVFVSPLVPMMAGVRVPYSQESIVGPGAVADLLFLGLLALFALGAVEAFRRRGTSDASLLYVVALLFGPIYAISPPTFESRQPRYLIVLAPVLVLLVAQLASTFRRAIALVGVATVLSAVVLHEMNAFRRTHPESFPQAPRNLAPLVAKLDRLGVRRAYGDYWIVYQLDFDTRERIIAVENDMHAVSFGPDGAVHLAPSFARLNTYLRAAQAAQSPAFVFFQRELKQEAIVKALERNGYRRYPVGPFVVVARPAT
jgi:4-amino-4-deoxy-L-arabinose transferase-like glycosyltransferase